jgi:hypothetical protein
MLPSPSLPPFPSSHSSFFISLTHTHTPCFSGELQSTLHLSPAILRSYQPSDSSPISSLPQVQVTTQPSKRIIIFASDFNSLSKVNLIVSQKNHFPTEYICLVDHIEESHICLWLSSIGQTLPLHSQPHPFFISF